jgi:cytochrome c553
MVQNCLHCHGAKGPDPSAQPRIPALAGQNLEYLVSQLREFKWRDRIDPSQTMNDIAIDLSEKEIREVAEYFASRDAHVGSGEPTLASGQRDLYLRGKELADRKCISCHRNAEYGNRPTSDLLPSLDGQSRIYLINQLIYFRNDQRSNPLMRALAQELSNADIEALATYFANVH